MAGREGFALERFGFLKTQTSSDAPPSVTRSLRQGKHATWQGPIDPTRRAILARLAGGSDLRRIGRAVSAPPADHLQVMTRQVDGVRRRSAREADEGERHAPIARPSQHFEAVAKQP
jgi:hypothetical protein